MNTRNVECASCGHALGPAPVGPCPSCGSTNRVYHEHVVDYVALLSRARFKHQDPAGLMAEGMAKEGHSAFTGRRVQSGWTKDYRRRLWSQLIIEEQPGGISEVVHAEELPLSASIKSAWDWLNVEILPAAFVEGAGVVHRRHVRYDRSSDQFVVRLGTSGAMHRIPAKHIRRARQGRRAARRHIWDSLRRAVRDPLATNR